MLALFLIVRAIIAGLVAGLVHFAVIRDGKSAFALGAALTFALLTMFVLGIVVFDMKVGGMY